MYHRILISSLLAVAVSLVSFCPADALATDHISTLLNSKAVSQINVLANEKAGRTFAQRKLDSQLIYAQKELRNETIMQSLPQLRHSIEIDIQKMTLVDIKAKVSTRLLQEIHRLGGEVVSSYAQYDAIRARLPLDKLEVFAEDADVRFIQPAMKAMTHKSTTSEGDAAHSAATTRNSTGFDGSGVKIGVLSDSVDYLAEVQALDDLPNVTVLQDLPGNSGEGTAMLEIVHDLAPGAELYFATAFESFAGFANNILALSAAGCDVIVDDVFYFAESPFQDDILTQAVNSVTADGVLYFSSAGNSGNFGGGTSTTWEGDYTAVTPPATLSKYDSVHDFSGGDSTNALTSKFYSTNITLHWNDPLGGAANDYDLFFLDPEGNVVAISNNYQNGDNDPFEYIGAENDPKLAETLNNYQVVIARWSGADRFIRLWSRNARGEHQTTGNISGHSAAENAFAVAAVEALGMTTPFDGTESVEPFSSDGPRRIFYEADGTPITPGNLSSTGGKVRQKPDIAAADGVETSTPGFNPFYGTSAAAPHAAALAALMLSKNPGLSVAEVRDIFNRTALDIEGPGFDNNSGAGIIMADLLLEQVEKPFPWMMFMPGMLGQSAEQ